ncbi:MAG: hypothetical protein AAB214_13480, partial [Fibrobacterota bacterium]
SGGWIEPVLVRSQVVLVALQECWRHAKGWSPSLPPGAPTDSVPLSSISDDVEAPPAFSEFDLLLTRVEALMGKAGFRPYVGDPESFRLAARRSLSRGRFERRDLRTFLTMVKTLERLTDKN